MTLGEIFKKFYIERRLTIVRAGYDSLVDTCKTKEMSKTIVARKMK